MSQRGANGGAGLVGWVLFVVIVAGAIAFAFVRNRGAGPATVAGPDAGEFAAPEKSSEPAGPEAVVDAAAKAPVATDASASLSVHLFLGNPSGASANPTEHANYLMVKPSYALSYNGQTGTPNWVSWKLSATDLGDAPRKGGFDADDELPLGVYRVTSRDYTGSGFDRGHMCPHSDRDASTTTSFATFVMTNIIPQAPNVNQKAWATLENYTRALVADGAHTAFIISGPWGKGGTGSKGRAETLANGRVTVPAECWKIVVLVPVGQDRNPGELNGATRVIAVRMPNDNAVMTTQWSGFRVSPDDLERQTGYRFFTTLRPEVAAALRQTVDGQVIADAPTPRYAR